MLNRKSTQHGLMQSFGVHLPKLSRIVFVHSEQHVFVVNIISCALNSRVCHLYQMPVTSLTLHTKNCEKPEKCIKTYLFLHQVVNYSQLFISFVSDSN